MPPRVREAFPVGPNQTVLVRETPADHSQVTMMGILGPYQLVCSKEKKVCLTIAVRAPAVPMQVVASFWSLCGKWRGLLVARRQISTCMSLGRRMCDSGFARRRAFAAAAADRKGAPLICQVASDE